MSKHLWTGHPIGDDDKRLKPRPPLNFIDIISTGPEREEEWQRTSSLLVEREGGSLRAVGNIPHGYTFKMKTDQDREKLAEWLQSKKTRALDQIHALMDGTEWDSETTSAIGEILTDNGYTIRDPNDAIGEAIDDGSVSPADLPADLLPDHLKGGKE